MNVVAGIIKGLVAGTWISVVKYSFYWTILHVAYGYLFGTHDNPVVNSSEGDNPMVSYYGARFITGLLTTGAVASLILVAVRLLGIS